MFTVKKKLLDSQMMAEYGEAWTEFNVKSAINAWRDSGRNFGLTVEVEDEDRVLMNALKYFEQMNCSIDANVLSKSFFNNNRNNNIWCSRESMLRCRDLISASS